MHIHQQTPSADPLRRRVAGRFGVWHLPLVAFVARSLITITSSVSVKMFSVFLAVSATVLVEELFHGHRGLDHFLLGRLPSVP